MIDVFIVSQSSLMCSLIATALGKESDIRVCGSTTDTKKAISLLQEQPCDVVLIKATSPENGTLDLIQRLRRVSTAKLLVMDAPGVHEVVLRYVEAGASGYIFAEDAVDALSRTIRAVHDGGAVLSPKLAATLISRLAELAAQRPGRVSFNDGFLDLTSREEDVLDLLGDGLSNREIADQLVIEVGTVKNHVHSILRKLEVNNRQEAAKSWNDISGQ